MKIAYAVPRYLPHRGGLETHVRELAVRAAAAGHDVDVLSQEVDVTVPRVEVIDGVVVRRFPVYIRSDTYPFAPGLWRYLAEHAGEYDLLHAHGYHALPALGAALLLRGPFVFTPHYHGTGHTPLAQLLHVPYRVAGRRIFRRAEGLICVSASEAALVTRHFPFVAPKVAIIPNGVDSEALRTATPYPTSNKIVFVAGRLQEYKNVADVVAAFAHLDNSFELVIAGEGPDRPRLEELTARRGTQARTRFLGQIVDDALYRWFRTAAVCVTMSSKEAYGLTLASAIAAGIPVVASDIGSHREILREVPKEAATLVPLNTAPEKLARIIRLASECQVEIGRPPPIASWDAVASQTLDLYDSVVTAERRKTGWLKHAS